MAFLYAVAPPEAAPQIKHNLLEELGLDQVAIRQNSAALHRMGRFVDQLAIAPDNLALRLENLFHLKAGDAVRELEGLVQETIALVETHMPQVDTVCAKRKLGWRQLSRKAQSNIRRCRLG